MRRLLVLALVIALWVGHTLAIPPQQANLFQAFVKSLREDMELLADAVFEGGRPATWTGNTALDSPTVVADLWFDNEQLADAVFGAGVRPPDWIGATTSNAELVTRNIRHDLELAADTALGIGTRPDGWQGAGAIYRCNRTLLNTVYLLNTLYNIRPVTPEGVLDYCRTVAAEVDSELVDLLFNTPEALEQAPELVLAARGDLERLADEKLGLGSRPSAWLGNKQLESPSLVSDIFTDLEALADELLGVNQRPLQWIGQISVSPSVSYRNIRHDLELLADATLGEGIRPNGWQGEDPLSQCAPSVQNLVTVVQLNYDFFISDEVLNAPDVCAAVEVAANFAAENPPADVITEEEAEDARFMGESEYAFAYLDLAALDYMGVMPKGTKFRAWYRNFGESNMMFVSGENFAVYIDRRWTTIERERFEQLPTIEGVRPLTFCDASWCNGPAPTPTPTGAGPLFEIISAATAPATIDPLQVQSQEQKQLVSWNHIRVNYLLQRPEIGAAQVTLEICTDPSQIACEPVLSIFDNSIGAPVQVLSQFNGLNVYELPYGYTTNLLIEGATLFSTDVWLNDPTLLTPLAPTAGP